ncbi:MAG TPA: hypothetical protein VFZ73_10830 [Gemmatimonadaceae bacterium]
MVIVLRLVHIIGGVFWVGSVMFLALMLAPSLRAVGPGGAPVMNQLVKVRRMPMVMMASAILTVAAGIWLLIIDSAGEPGVWMRSGTGQTFSIGGALAIVGFIIGMAVNLPASKRLAAIGTVAAARGGPPTAEESTEMQRLQGRMSIASNIVMLLLVLATAAMAVARYVQ